MSNNFIMSLKAGLRKNDTKNKIQSELEKLNTNENTSKNLGNIHVNLIGSMKVNKDKIQSDLEKLNADNEKSKKLGNTHIDVVASRKKITKELERLNEGK